MIYSPDHNFLLLKNMKVGGTSLEVELSKNLPQNAIVTPKTFNNKNWLVKNPTTNHNYFPRNHEFVKPHSSYGELEKFYDLSKAKTYLFVRNPYNSVLSHFFHRLYLLDQKVFDWNILDKEQKNNLLDKYFNNELGIGIPIPHDIHLEWYTPFSKLYYDNNRNFIIDKFLKYENGIENEINPVLEEHKINKIKINIHENNFKKNNLTYEEVFRKKDIEKIQNSWSWEFEYFKYKI
jgi:hypothetical protein